MTAKMFGYFSAKVDRAPAAFDGGADRDDAGDTGLGGATQDIIEVAGEIRVVEMRVSFDQHDFGLRIPDIGKLE